MRKCIQIFIALILENPVLVFVGLSIGIFLGIVGKVGAGTFIVDHICLFIGGYAVTYFLYKHGLPKVKNSFLRRIPIMLYFLTIAVIFTGGFMTYFNFAESGDVYFGLLSQKYIGPVDGNDFMWNGFGVDLLIGRVVPEALIPTYQYLGFNILAVVSWLFLPISLGWGCLRGNAVASLKNPRFSRLLLEHIRAVGIGFVLWVIMIGLATMLSGYYLTHVV